MLALSQISGKRLTYAELTGKVGQTPSFLRPGLLRLAAFGGSASSAARSGNPPEFPLFFCLLLAPQNLGFGNRNNLFHCVSGVFGTGFMRP